MYHYDTYRCEDIDIIRNIVSDYSLALIVSSHSDGLLATHAPLIWNERDKKHIELIGHLDNNNPHLSVLDKSDVLVIFSGPDHYISPSDYATKQLPTWNYVRVHAHGTARVFTPGLEILEDIDKLVEHVETGSKRWRMDHGDARVRRLAPLISRLVVNVHSIEGRFKLSQEKSEVDRQAALRPLLMGRSDRQNANIEKIASINNW